ncbi:MAG: hypothetical protein IIT58_08245 [Treponema sp.]|nr:hypothetical protein [Treponema sp.]
MAETTNRNQIDCNEDWEDRRAGLIAHVKKSADCWTASIGMISPIGAGFTKSFSTRKEAIHFVSDYFSKKFGK